MRDVELGSKRGRLSGVMVRYGDDLGTSDSPKSWQMLMLTDLAAAYEGNTQRVRGVGSRRHQTATVY